MRRKNRGIKLHDLNGWVHRILVESEYKIEDLSEKDRNDLEVRFAARLIKIVLKPRILLPIPI